MSAGTVVAAGDDERPDHPMATLVPCEGGLVLWHESPDLARAWLLCFGRKHHYRKAGGCRHVDAVLAALRPELRAKTEVVGWGGKGAGGTPQQGGSGDGAGD